MRNTKSSVPSAAISAPARRSDMTDASAPGSAPVQPLSDVCCSREPVVVAGSTAVLGGVGAADEAGEIDIVRGGRSESISAPPELPLADGLPATPRGRTSML